MIHSAKSFTELPPGRKWGLKPRMSRVGEWCTRAEDAIDIIPRDEWADRAKKLPVVPYIPEILDQGKVGSCAAEATTGATMTERAIHGLPHVSLNPYFLYHHTSGGVDRGSSIDENLAVARDMGIAPISVWPRSKGWRQKPSDEAYEAAENYRIREFYDVTSINELVSCLLHGFLVVAGANGHAVYWIEHIDESKGRTVNSWGTDWGEGGIGVWCSYRAINWAYGAFAVRVAT